MNSEHFLLTCIQHHCDELFKENPFFKKMAQRELSSFQVGLYLFNLKHLFRASMKDLKAAKLKAQSEGQRQLAQFFVEKCQEEENHDLWAEADLKHLKLQGERYTLLPSMQKHLARLEQLAQEQPAQYLIYVFFAEYITVYGGPYMVAGMAQNGVPPEHFSAIAKHVELDQDHVAHDLSLMEKLLTDPDDIEYSVALVKRWSQFLQQFFVELELARPPRREAQHGL